jgi:hypothetical protein
MFVAACRPPSDGILTISLDICTRHPSGKNLIAMAYQDGSIRIYNYPCQTSGVSPIIPISMIMMNLYVNIPFKQAEFIELQGICSQCWRLRFSTDGVYLIALDSYSRCIVKYKISYDTF